MPARYLFSWPNYDPAFVLQVRDRLHESVPWQDDPSPRTLDGSFYQVVVAINEGQRFYRLIRR